MGNRKKGSNQGPKLMFGKHKGLSVREVPDQYLSWAINSIPESSDFFVKEKAKIRCEINRRDGIKICPHCARPMP